MISKVRKRDSRLEEFQQEKIANAIAKALKAVGKHGRLAIKLSDEVVHELNKNYYGKVPSVENIQDAAPEDVRKAYMLSWKLKCKGIAVYRYGSKENQVLTIGSLEKELGGKHVIAESEFAGGCAGVTCPH